MSLNKVQLIGHLGADPEVKYTQGGMTICRLRVATSEKRKDRAGNVTETTEWHTVKAFGQLADICGEFLAKGKQAYFEGRLHYDTFEKDGVTKHFTEIMLDKMEMLGGRGDGAQRTSEPAARRAPPTRQAPAPAPAAADDFADDDIPF